MASMTKIPQKTAPGSDYRKNRYQGDGPAKCTWFPGTTEKKSTYNCTFQEKQQNHEQYIGSYW